MSENKEENLPEGLCIICGKPVEITDGTDPDLTEVSHYACEESQVGNSQPEVKSHDPAHFSGPVFRTDEGSHRIAAGYDPEEPKKRITQIRPGLFMEVSGYDPENGRATKDPYLGNDGACPRCHEHHERKDHCQKKISLAFACDHVVRLAENSVTPEIRAQISAQPCRDCLLKEQEEHPLLCFTKDMECSRCKGVGKIQNTNPRLLVTFIDCPDCAGEGKTQTYEPVSEASLDEGIALGMELAQLRKAKALAYEATTKILGILHLAHSLAKETPHIQAEAAAKNIKEAVKVTGELQRELLSGEYPKPNKPHPEDAAIKQAQDLAQKGYAAVYGTPLGQGVYMVDENTIPEWRSRILKAKNWLQRSGPLSPAIDDLNSLLKSLPGGDQ